MTAPTDAERAREIVKHLRPAWGKVFTPDGVEQMADTLEQLFVLALREVRADERERAARIADDHAQTCPSDLCCRDDAPVGYSHAQVIRDAIRRQEVRDA